MSDVVRKRLTKVGSGAWSVYIPKKWIDEWTPEQQERRDVDLRRVGQGVLIAPVHEETSFEAEVANNALEVRTMLLSSYVRGNHTVRLTHAEGFDNDVIAAARDFLRHLDERIRADCRADAIGFHLQNDLPPPAADAQTLLNNLVAKVGEVMRLVDDALRTSGHDVDRNLHALRLLRDTHQEDVDRVFYQTVRMVATLEIPLESVSLYQLLGLAAADLQRASTQGLRIAETMLKAMKLELADLDYPRRHLLETIKAPPPPTGVARGMLGACRTSAATIQELLPQLAAALNDGDVQGLAAVGFQSRQAAQELHDAVLTSVAEHWGHEDEDVVMAFTISKYATSLQNVLDHLESICHHATGLLAAEAR